ncbi:MAG: TetR/AcrR family transcriptional regulator [Nocardioides sp.]
MTRAPRLAPAERRTVLIDATLPLLMEHGRGVTTKQIAEAAGVAEGTIFVVFDSKEDLIEQTLAAAFDLAPFEAALDALPTDVALRQRLIRYVELLQQRLTSIFGLMRAMGIVAPPESARHRSPERKRIFAKAAAYVAPAPGELAVSVDELMHLVRLLTFSGSHYEIAHGRLLSPEEVVSVVLDGVARERSPVPETEPDHDTRRREGHS